MTSDKRLADTNWKDHMKHKPYPGSENSSATERHVNDLDGFESFILQPGQKKVEEKLDTRMPNTSIFTFNREDHTLGNLLRAKLLANSHVTFSAYRVPHPLFPSFELRVSTDGEITPKQALIGASRDLVSELSVLGREFTKEYELRKMVSGNQNGQ